MATPTSVLGAKEPVINLTEHTDLAAKYLSVDALAAMDKKAATLIHADDTGTYISIYLSLIVKAVNIEKGIERICQGLNALASEGLIHSTLSTPSSIELVIAPNMELSRAVFAYVLVPASKKEYAEKLAGVAMPKDGQPLVFEDLETKRPEGEFTSTLKLSHVITLVKNAKSSKEMAQDYANKLLAILPTGTELLSLTEYPITGLYLPFVATFFNPVMKDYKEVELVYERKAACIKDRFEEFNLLTGINYIRR